MEMKILSFRILTLLNFLHTFTKSLNRDEYHISKIKFSSHTKPYAYYNNEIIVENYIRDKMKIIETIKEISYERTYQIRCINPEIFEMDSERIDTMIEEIHIEISESEDFLDFIDNYYYDPEDHYDEIDEYSFIEWSMKIEEFLKEDHKLFLTHLENQKSSIALENQEYQKFSIDEFFKKTFPCSYIYYLFPIQQRIDSYFIRPDRKVLFEIECKHFANHKMILDYVHEKIENFKNEPIDLLNISFEINKSSYLDEIDMCECLIFKKSDRCLESCATFGFKYIYREKTTEKKFRDQIFEFISVFSNLGSNEIKFPIVFDSEINGTEIKLIKDKFVVNVCNEEDVDNELLQDKYGSGFKKFLIQFSFLSQIIYFLGKPDVWNSHIKMSDECIYKYFFEFIACLSYESLFHTITQDQSVKNQILTSWKPQKNTKYEIMKVRHLNNKVQRIQKLFEEIDNKIAEFKNNILKELKIDDDAKHTNSKFFYPIRMLKVFSYSYILAYIKTDDSEFYSYIKLQFKKRLHIYDNDEYKSYLDKKMTDPDIYTPEEYDLINMIDLYTIDYQGLKNPIDMVFSSFYLKNLSKKRKITDSIRLIKKKKV